jgi:hypothetical protein
LARIVHGFGIELGKAAKTKKRGGVKVDFSTVFLLFIAVELAFIYFKLPGTIGGK